MKPLLLLLTPAAAVVEYVALTPVGVGGGGAELVKWARLEYARNASSVDDVTMALLDAAPEDGLLGAWFDLNLTTCEHVV